MSDLAAQKRADLSEALVMAMEPEAWARVNGPEKAEDEDGVRVIRAIRHATAVMMLLQREGMI